MKWPLKFHNDVLRQTVCWLAGHDWKSSWRSRDDRGDREARDNAGALSYREKHEGNPYCWHSAGWHYKCRRCRLRTREDRYDPWFKVLWWAIKNAATSYGCVVEAYGNYPFGPRLVALLVVGPCFAFVQGWGQFDRVPWWPMDVAWAIEHRVSNWLERQKPAAPPPPPKQRAIITRTPDSWTANSGTTQTFYVRFEDAA